MPISGQGITSSVLFVRQLSYQYKLECRIDLTDQLTIKEIKEGLVCTEVRGQIAQSVLRLHNINTDYHNPEGINQN